MSTYRQTEQGSSTFLAAGAVGWVVVVDAVALGLLSLSLIDLVVLLELVVVLPLALGGPIWPWEVAAGAALASFLLPDGPAAVLALPFVAAAGATCYRRLSVAGRSLSGMRLGATATATATVGRGRAGAWQPKVGGVSREVLEVLAATYAVVAAVTLVQSRLGLQLFGVGEPIVELTSVHFAFAGTVGLTLAGAAAGVNPVLVSARRAGAGAVGLTAAAPPVVALGFVTRSSGLQIAGAVLMTLGVWLTAILQLGVAQATPHRLARALLTVSGLAVWAPMGLAVAWAAAQHWDVPTLSITDMARTHGVLNGFGFCLCGLLGWKLRPQGLPAQRLPAGPVRSSR